MTERHAWADALLRAYDALDRALVAAGFPPTSPWWRAHIERFLRSGCRRWVIRAGRRAGKSSTLCRLAVVVAVFGTWTVPPGDRAVIAFISVDRDEASDRIHTIREILRVLSVGFDQRGDDLELHDRPAVFSVITCATRATVGFTTIVIFGDEMAMWESRDSAANPAQQVMSSLRPTMATQPFAFEVCSSSPWSTEDYHAELFEAGDTDHQLTSHAATWEANPTITEELTRELEPDAEVWARAYAAIPGALSSAQLLNPLAMRRNTRERPLELVPEDGAFYGAAVDVGETRLTLVVVEAYESAEDDEAGGELPYFRVACAHEAIGGSPGARWQEIAQRCARYGVDTVSVDQYAATANATIAAQYGLTLDVTPWAAANRLEAFTNLATLTHSDRIEFAPHKQLRNDLRAIKKRLTQTGATIVIPTTKDGRHSDFAPALAAAIRTAAQVANIDTDLSIGGHSSGRLGDPQTMDGWGAARTEHLRHSRILEQLPRRDERGRPYHYVTDHGDSAS